LVSTASGSAINREWRHTTKHFSRVCASLAAGKALRLNKGVTWRLLGVVANAVIHTGGAIYPTAQRLEMGGSVKWK